MVRLIPTRHISQLELKMTKGWNNCGPTSFTIQLDCEGYLGADVSDEERHDIADWVRDGAFDGDYWANSYTDYPLMRELGKWKYAAPTEVVYSWAEVFKAVDDGFPVQILLHNAWVQPRQYPDAPGWVGNHFIVVRGYDDRLIYTNDPLSDTEGSYTRESVATAVAKVGGVYALIVRKGEVEVVNVADQMIVDTVRNLGLDSAGVADMHTRVDHYEQVEIPDLQREVAGLNITTRLLTEQRQSIEDMKAALETDLRSQIADLVARPPVIARQVPPKIALEYPDEVVRYRLDADG